MRGVRGLVGILACAVVVTSVVAVPAGTAAEDREVLIDTATEGLYNEALGTRLDGTQTQFPCADIRCGDPTLANLPEPDLSSVDAILGDWLAPDPAMNANWSGPGAVPPTWAINTETAIVYELDAGAGGLTDVRASFGIDNGLFLWVDGSYVFGAMAPGGASPGEYVIEIGDLDPGVHHLQVLREDHGGATGYHVEITGVVGEVTDTPEPEPDPVRAPVADAGEDQAVSEGSTVTLDGSGSHGSGLIAQRWTTTADFQEGEQVNLDDVADQLRLDDSQRAFDFIWIAASGRGTVVKIDTRTGDVLGEYWSAPQNRPKNPSRTTVDKDGAVWVGNRNENGFVAGVRKGSVAKIGLEENGGCEDRNGNGVIDTSSGLGDVRPWPNGDGSDTAGGTGTAADECVVEFVRTNGVNIRHVSVDLDNHVWVGGPTGGGAPRFFDRLAPDGTMVRSINLASAADTGRSGGVRHCCYGGLVDANGILWSSSGGGNVLVRLDTSKPNGDPDLVRVISLGRTSYGLGIDPDGFLWQSNWTWNTIQKIAPDGSIVGRFSTGGPSNDRGVAVTADGDVWVANSGGSSVSRLANDGTFRTQVAVGREPTGVAVDAAGKVWAANRRSNSASRIDPASNAVDLTVPLGPGAAPYNYSDMTGATLTGAPDTGTWQVVHDSEAAGTSWALADWTADLPGDSSVTVRLATSEDGVSYSPEVEVAKGDDLSALPDGRFVRATVQLRRASSGESPVLHDLTLARPGGDTAVSHAWELVAAAGPPVFLTSTTSPTPSFVAPDDGTYTFELTVTDASGLTASDRVTVTVDNLDPTLDLQAENAFARGVTRVDGTLTDPGWLDVHRATFDWGDGTVDEEHVAAQGSGWGTLFGSHVYADAGTYTVTVTLVDDDGGSVTKTLSDFVVAEPVALWANSTTANKTLDWGGGTATVTGRVHSNHDLLVRGEPKTIHGPLEHVGSLTVEGQHDLDPVEVDPADYPVTFDLADYRPGGPVSQAVGADYHDLSDECGGNGRWQIENETLPSGVYYVSCGIEADGSRLGGRVTLVAEGTIWVDGSNPAFEPYWDGLLLLAGSSDKKAVELNTESSRFLGVVHAPDGGILLGGSDNRFFCGILGDRVTVSGSDLDLRGATCGRPDSTVSGPLLVPDLALDLEGAPGEVLPDDQIDYQLRVGNDGALLVVPGLLGLENVDDAPVSVTGLTYGLERYSIADGAWVPVATWEADGSGVTADGIDLRMQANDAAGVSYPDGDPPVVGTTIEAGGLATWGSQALVELTPDQVELLLDETATGGIRNHVEFTLDPTSVQVRRLFTRGTDFIDQLRALSGDIAGAEVLLLLPHGDPVTLTSAELAELATLAPGAAVASDHAFTVPVPAPRSALETDDGYLARLAGLDNSQLIAAAFVLADGGVGQLVAPLTTTTSTERLPVVDLETTGPAAVPAGDTVTYDLDLANQGSADADLLTVEATAGDDPLNVDDAPTALAAGEVATATVGYTAPDDGTADTTIRTRTDWSDANGNTYGPVGPDHDVKILAPPTLQADLVDDLVDDVGDDGFVSPGDTVRYTLTVRNDGGQPLTDVAAGVTPDVNGPLSAGSVTVDGTGTVASGNASGDTSVEVEWSAVAAGTAVTATFEVVVADPFPDGVTRLEVQGTVAATGFDLVPTDDPARAGGQDPTWTTVVVPTPALDAYLSGRLLLDRDGDGVPSAGDRLRYDLAVHSVGSLPVTDTAAEVLLPDHVTLVDGSVTTNAGTPGAGPNVAVDIAVIDPFDTVSIAFDLDVDAPLPSGVVELELQGSIASAELDPVPTDDPATFTLDDPTVLSLRSASGSDGSGSAADAPAVTNLTPEDGATITEPVTVSATADPIDERSISAWTVSTYRRGAGAASAEVLASFGGVVAAGSDIEPLGSPDGEATIQAAAEEDDGTTGDPVEVAATFDPTVRDNGIWVVRIVVTDDAGATRISETTLVVDGGLKLGRVVTSYQDVEVGAGGFPLEVRRTYDSLRRDVSGDFGHGWDLDVVGPRVQTNTTLGLGPWTAEACGAGLVFVPLCWSSERPRYVTVTWPDGGTETFDFTPTGNTFFQIGIVAEYTARTGVTSTLEPVGADGTGGINTSDGHIHDGWYGDGPVYDPTQFLLTDRFGTEYLLDVVEGLLEMTDRTGNRLTVDDTGITSSFGPSVSFLRDDAGRIEQVDGPEDLDLTYGYDENGDLVSVIDPNGAETTYEYLDHRLTGVIGPDTTRLATYTYEDGRLKTITDGEGNTTVLDIDVSGRTETITSADGRLTTVVTSDELGNTTRVDEVFDDRQLTSTFTYEPETDLLTSSTDPLGHITELMWNDDRDLVSVTDAEQRTTTFEYEQPGLLSQVTAPSGEIRLERDYENTTGQLLWERRGGDDATLTTYGYTGGLLTDVTGPGTLATTLTYRPDGLVETITDALDRTVTYGYDDAGRINTVTDPSAATVTFEYDDVGNLTSVTDAQSRTRSYTYNTLGQLENLTDADLKVATYAYDDAGNLTEVVDRTGVVTDIIYDAMNRVIDRTSSDGTTSSFTYDPLGRPTLLTSDDATVEFDWDDASRLAAQSTVPAGSGPTTTYTYGYDDTGLLTTVAGPGGPTAYGYDTDALLDWVEAAPAGRIEIGHDEAGRLTQVARPNGLVDTIDWTGFDTIASRVTETTTGDVLARAEYTYSAGGQRATLTDLDGTHTFGYDPVGRAASVDRPASSPLPDESYGFDPGGNLVDWPGVDPAAVSLDPAGRLAGDGKFTYTWDEAGRLTSKTEVATGEAASYTWNADDLLTSIDPADGPRQTYTYDPLGRRIAVTVDGVTRWYGWDGVNVTAELDADGTVTARHVTGSAPGSVLATIEGTGEVSWPLVDGLGSVVAVANDAGVVTDRFAWDLYGNPVGAIGDQTYGFTGHGWEHGAALHHARARWYDPANGRFLSEDPVPSNIPHAYVGGDPANLTDPLGLVATVEHGVLTSGKDSPKAGVAGTQYRTWNHFQAATRGKFATRWDAARAWDVYKKANGIQTGVVRSQAARSRFLRGLADSGKAPRWMNQWLRQGKVPPGYNVDHITPLSVGGADLPANMRLVDIATHKLHHRFFRPWEWI